MTEPTETLRVGDCRACRARVAGLHGAHDALTCVCTEPCEGCETSHPGAGRPDLPAAIAGLRRDQPSCDSHEPSVDSTDAAPGGNAEHCLACAGVDVPYPWICPGHDTPDGLRVQYAEAMRDTVTLSGQTPTGEEQRVLDDLTTAVMAVRDREMQQLRAQAARLEPAIIEQDRLAERLKRARLDEGDQRDRAEQAEAGRDELRAALADVIRQTAPEPGPAAPAYWAQTIHTTDAGHTIRIPGTHHSPAGDETREVLVRREDVPVLRDMLNSALAHDSQPTPDQPKEN